VSIPPPESPLVQEYLACFGEVARLVGNAANVPDDLWRRTRESWASMNTEERDEVERRVREAKR
jgi:hypothetical protein